MNRLKMTLLFSVLFVWIHAALGQPDAEQKDFYNEEVIRYLGYEENLSRYISLPYDITMSHNVEKNFMDIGFLLLMFVPIIFLMRVRSWRLTVLLAILLGMMVFISIGTSHVLSKDGVKVPVNTEHMSQHLQSPDLSGWPSVLASIYDQIGKLYAPLGRLLESLTGQADHMTYPVLIVILYLLYFVYHRFHSRNPSHLIAGIFILFYSFFMLILSAGIIWYGFLLFPLLYIEISKYSSISKKYKWLFLPAGFVFVVMAYFLKVSGLYFLGDKGIGMIAPPILEYNFSGARGGEVYDAYFRNVGSAMNQINAEDESLVLLAGTSLTYLVRKNHQRVLKDGVLSIFNQLVEELKTKEAINIALKSSGFRYIIFSPNLHVMDQTPERTLTHKYQLMLSYLHENPGLELLATDRVVRRKNETGVLYNDFGMFGERDQPIVYNGTYAIYEIQ